MGSPLRIGSEARQAPSTELKTFLLTFFLGALMIPGAFAIAYFVKVNLAAAVNLSAFSAGVGVAATLPLLFFLAWFAKTDIAPIAAFRKSQVEFFASIGFEFTALRIVLLALVAGVGEELVFRGALQGAAMRALPAWLAILLPNLIFGVLHARTVSYALIAGIVGMWLGAVAVMTQGLAAPIIAHALYDLVAFEYTRRAIKAARKEKPAQPRVARSTDSSVTG